MWKWTWPWKSRLCRAKVDETQVGIKCTLLVPWVKLIRLFFCDHCICRPFVLLITESNKKRPTQTNRPWSWRLVELDKLLRSCLGFLFWVDRRASEALRRLYDAQVLLQSYEEQPNNRATGAVLHAIDGNRATELWNFLNISCRNPGPIMFKGWTATEHHGLREEGHCKNQIQLSDFWLREVSPNSELDFCSRPFVRPTETPFEIPFLCGGWLRIESVSLISACLKSCCPLLQMLILTSPASLESLHFHLTVHGRFDMIESESQNLTLNPIVHVLRSLGLSEEELQERFAVGYGESHSPFAFCFVRKKASLLWSKKVVED